LSERGFSCFRRDMTTDDVTDRLIYDVTHRRRVSIWRHTTRAPCCCCCRWWWCINQSVRIDKDANSWSPLSSHWAVRNIRPGQRLVVTTGQCVQLMAVASPSTCRCVSRNAICDWLSAENWTTAVRACVARSVTPAGWIVGRFAVPLTAVFGRFVHWAGSSGIQDSKCREYRFVFV